jgi:phospholipid-translocating ATPase
LEEPNGNLYKLDGKLTVMSPAPEDEKDEESSARPWDGLMNEATVLLRGMKMMNTVKAWGIVVYAGHETKIMKNNERDVQIKMSMVDRMLNKNLVIILVLLGFFCIVCAIMSGLWTFANVKGQVNEGAWYIGLNNGFEDSWSENWYGYTNGSIVGILSFFTFLLLFANLVPISLYFTIESVKFCIGSFINCDAHMYDEEKDMCGKCRNTNIIEEVGQVEYVLSDKTGTLTQNKMELLKFSAGGEKFGEGSTEIEIGKAKRAHDSALAKRMKSGDESIKIPELQPELDKVKEAEKNNVDISLEVDKSFLFFDKNVSGLKWLTHPKKEDIKNFLVALGVCHTTGAEEKDNGFIKYNPANPDDGALVKACANLGVQLRKTAPKAGHITEYTFEVAKSGPPPGEKETEVWKVHETINFTSARKRMSVIAEDPEQNLRIFMKGADNFISDRLLESEKEPDTERGEFFRETQDHANEFANNGLRTLFVACKDVEMAYFDEWKKKYGAALEAKKREGTGST